MTQHVFRLHRGDDLCTSIQNFAAERHIAAGYIACSVGCVTQARIRDASGVNIRTIDEHMEIVSITGTVSERRCHIHITFSKEDMSTIGGHLVEGCIINTTAEIVIVQLDGLYFDKTFDEETGYHELDILPDSAAFPPHRPSFPSFPTKK